MAKEIRDPAFFTQPAVELAQALLGKVICTVSSGSSPVMLRITETEAYPYMNYATHATCYKSGNGVTQQEKIGGTLYVHDNNQKPRRGSGFDIVSGDLGKGESVLIRSGTLLPSHTKISGPDMVGRALNMFYDTFNGQNLTFSPIVYLLDDDYCVDSQAIQVSTRINVPQPESLPLLNPNLDKSTDLRFRID